MNKAVATIILTLSLIATEAGAQVAPSQAGGTGIYAFTLADIDGNPTSLSSFKGKVLLIVNVASRCGYTYQYEGLEALYARYKDRGLVILGIPSNDFLGQEPGSNADIKQFCTLTYGVSFPMFSKAVVKGAGIHPLYGYLTSKKANGAFGGAISWNFNKFLVGRDGATLARFDSKEEPGSAAVAAAVERALGGPK